MNISKLMHYSRSVCYTWEDQNYRDLMIKIVRTLEPRRLEAGKIIYKTLEEVDEIYFIEKGAVDIGFEINREPNYVIRL
jgi:CRP-like cAMP-binding protein